MKYIDADRLKVVIKQTIHREELNFAALGGGGQTFCINTLEWVLTKIDSLQQEHPDFPITNEQIKEFLATHPKIKVPEKYKNPDWLFNEQEQPEVDLKVEIDFEWAKCNPTDEGMGSEYANISIEQFDALARHFFELGRLNARKEE